MLNKIMEWEANSSSFESLLSRPISSLLFPNKDYDMMKT